LQVNSELHDCRATRQRVFQTLGVGLNVASQRRHRLIWATHSTKIVQRRWAAEFVGGPLRG
jgi:hypothetical protein